MTNSTPAYLHSFINKSGTSAEVHDPIRGQRLANVRRANGFWEATCAMSGALLLPRIPHTEKRVPANAWHKATAIAVPQEVKLGEVLAKLRPVLLGATA